MSLISMLTLISPFRALALVGLLSAAAGAETTFRSGPARVALLELYTSEGCSSCPPAEKWLGELRTAAGLWRDFVPVAFHVNYWDHLGWRDALASKAFTDRQHAYAATWSANSVYTPGFVRNGAEWRPRLGAPLKSDDANAGALTLHWDATTNACTIEYVPARNPPDKKAAGRLEVSIALLGGGIVHQIRKGENSGRELRHEFVALRLETIALARGAPGTGPEAWTATASLPPRTEIVNTRRALAAWVTTRGQLTPLQAAGGWLEQ
ncbi:MAG: DUF1223 domain-containing protein [Opitutus sp.]|nr:DUF1223 domain-containing protein [Opitutus sp.]